MDDHVAGSKEQSNKKENPTVFIVGDSMIKHLKQQRFSKSTNTKTRIKAFIGANIRDMKDYIKPALRCNPDKVILHNYRNK